MWFKNLQVYRLPVAWQMSQDQLEAFLATAAFTSCTSLEMQTQGWVSPRGDDQLVYSANRQFLLQLNTEKKLLPSTVINQVAKAKAAEIAEEQGFPLGRKRMKELKEQVTDELLPRAFSVVRSTLVWIDPLNGWLIVDAGSPAKGEEVLKLLLKCVTKFPVDTFRTVMSPQGAMTSWLLDDEAPGRFTIDQDTELRANDNNKATVRYVHHSLDPADIKRHIEAGKQCTKLALTWNDRISFVLTDNMTLKRVAPLDVLKEEEESFARAEDEKFESDFTLMTGELNQLLLELTTALGGELKENDGQAAA